MARVKVAPLATADLEQAAGDAPERYGIRAVDRAGRILQVLGQAHQAMTLSEIAVASELSPATTLRMLRTLQSLDLVQVRKTDDRYLLGFAILRLSQSLQAQLDVVQVAQPFLVQVRNEVDENTGLDVRDEDFWVPVARLEARYRLRLVSHIGQRLQLYSGASGKVLLSGMTDHEINDYLRRTPLIPLSPATPTTPEAVWEQIKGVRTKGYAVSLNERGEGGAAIASPVYDHTGRIIASFKIGGSVTRFTEDRLALFIPLVVRTAQELSDSLGYNRV